MVRRVCWLVAAAVLLAACGGSADPLAVGQDDDLAYGVAALGPPPDCEVAGRVDPALVDLLRLTVGDELALGPAVLTAIDDGSGDRVLTVQVLDDDGRPADAASWLVDEAGQAPQLLPLDPVAVALSPTDADTSRALQADPGGSITLEGSVGNGVAIGQDCSMILTEQVAPPPPQPEPELDEDLLVATPSTVTPGTVVELTFPQQTDRGVAFQLDAPDGDGRTTRWWMTSDANGGEPVTVPAGTSGYGTDDVGVGGPGPDRVLIHPDTAPGDYRLCTANAGDDFCVALEVTAG